MIDIQSMALDRSLTELGQGNSAGPSGKIPVWDFPTRLFHWLLVIAGLAAPAVYFLVR